MKYHDSMKGVWRPVFYSDMLHSYYAVFERASQKLMEKLRNAAQEGKEVNVTDYLSLMNLDIVTRAAFG